MQEISKLQGRMEAALDRIAREIEGLGAGSEAARSLETELAAERDRSARLETRLSEAESDAADRIAGLEAELSETRALLASVEEDRGRLRAAGDTLRATCERLRTAAAKGAGDADLINDAMQAEIAAIGAARQSDRAELDAIVGMLAETGEQQNG